MLDPLTLILMKKGNGGVSPTEGYKLTISGMFSYLVATAEGSKLGNADAEAITFTVEKDTAIPLICRPTSGSMGTDWTTTNCSVQLVCSSNDMYGFVVGVTSDNAEIYFSGMD